MSHFRTFLIAFLIVSLFAPVAFAYSQVDDGFKFKYEEGESTEPEETPPADEPSDETATPGEDTATPTEEVTAPAEEAATPTTPIVDETSPVELQKMTPQEIFEKNKKAIGTIETEFKMSFEIVGGAFSLDSNQANTAGKTSIKDKGSIAELLKTKGKTYQELVSHVEEKMNRQRTAIVDGKKCQMAQVKLSEDEEDGKIRGKISGTGWIFYKADKPRAGTCNHVVYIEKTEFFLFWFWVIKVTYTDVKYTFIDYNERKHSADVVWRNKTTDLGVIEIKDLKDYDCVTTANSDAVKEGDPLISIGSPYGQMLEHTLTIGHVSRLHRKIDLLPAEDYIQTDCPINGGNSGGPVFNEYGQVYGVAGAGVRGADGLSFAIPVNVFQKNPRPRSLLEQFVSLAQNTYNQTKKLIGKKRPDGSNIGQNERYKKDTKKTPEEELREEIFRNMLDNANEPPTYEAGDPGFLAWRINFNHRVGGDEAFREDDIADLKEKQHDELVNIWYNDPLMVNVPPMPPIPGKADLKEIASGSIDSYAVISYLNSAHEDENVPLLRAFDNIIAIDGHPVKNMSDINFYLVVEKLPGETVELTVLRPFMGKMHEEKVTITLE